MTLFALFFIYLWIMSIGKSLYENEKKKANSQIKYELKKKDFL